MERRCCWRLTRRRGVEPQIDIGSGAATDPLAATRRPYRARAWQLGFATTAIAMAAMLFARPAAQDPPLVELRPITINLSDPGRHYALLRMALVIHEDGRAKDVGARAPLLRDAVIRHVSTLTSAELKTSEGQNALRSTLTGIARSIYGRSVTRVVLSDLTVE